MQLVPIGETPPQPDPVVQTAHIHRTGIRAMVALPDGHTVLSGAQDGSLVRWSAETGQALQAVGEHQGAVLHAAANGPWVVTAGEDCTVRVWRLEEALRAHGSHHEATRAVRQVALTDRVLVAVGDDGIVRVYDLQAGHLLHELKGHEQRVIAVGLAGDGRTAVTAGVDGSLLQWDIEAGVRLAPLRQGSASTGNSSADNLKDRAVTSGGAVRALHFLEPQQLLVIGSQAGQGLVEHWSLPAEQPPRRLPSLAWPIAAALVEGERVFMASDTEVRGVACSDWERPLISVAAPSAGATGLAVLGERLVVGGRDGSATVLDVSQWQPEERHLSFAANAMVSPDGRVAATVDHDNRVRLWSTATGTPRAVLDATPEPLGKPIAFSDDGQLIATSRRHGRPAVALYHHDGRPAGQLDHARPDGSAFSVGALMFAWDGVLVAPHHAGKIQWWGLDGQATGVLEGATCRVQQLAMQGQYLIAEAIMPRVSGEPAVPHLQVWDLWRRCSLWSRPAQPRNGLPPARFGPLVILAGGGLLTGTGAAVGELGRYDLQRGQVVSHADVGQPWMGATEGQEGSIYVVCDNPEAQVREVVRLTSSLSIETRRSIPFGEGAWAVCGASDRAVWTQRSTVVLEQLSSGMELARVQLPREISVCSIALSQTGDRIVVGGRSGRVHVLRIDQTPT